MNPWDLIRHAHVGASLMGGTAKLVVSTDRLGKPFVPFSTMLRDARLNRRQSESDLAASIGKDKSLICRLESPRQDKMHASVSVIMQLAIGFGLDPFECYTAYVAEIRPEFRAIAYPDDPGPAGKTLGLPLTGAQVRLTTARPRS